MIGVLITRIPTARVGEWVYPLSRVNLHGFCWGAVEELWCRYTVLMKSLGTYYTYYS